MVAKDPWNPATPSPMRYIRVADTAATPPSPPHATRRATGQMPPSGHAMGNASVCTSRPV
jgi:hypothetical protein